MKLSLSRGTIITEGLSKAGRPDLIADARLWLNLFLEDFYYNQDVEWLVKSLNAQAVSDGMAMPTDYRAARSAVIMSSSGSASIEIINNSAQYDEARKQNAAYATLPQFIYANHDERKFYFVPIPTGTVTMDLKYFYVPAIADHTNPASDSLVPKWELPSSILVDMIKFNAMEYNDDKRQGDALKMADDKISKSKINNRDSRAGSSRIQMGKRFRKRF